MRTETLLAATAALALVAGGAAAQDKKQLVIVVKGLDNPFFEAINQGCQKWNAENPDSEYECFYTGPASTSDEAGEAQVIQDMLSKPSTAAIAISPSNAPLHAQTVKSSGTDRAGDDHRRRLHRRGRRRPPDLPRHRQLHDGLPHRRVHQGEEARRRHDLHDRGQPGRRQHPAPRPGHARRASPAPRASRRSTAARKSGGWTEVAGCPVFTNDDGPKGVQAMADILAANPDLDAFGIMGGWPLFGAPQPYRDLFKPMADKIASGEFVIGAADTIGEEVALAKEGLVTALVGQRPFEMGYMAPTVMIDLIEGKEVADPVFTGLDECTKDTADTCIQK